MTIMQEQLHANDFDYIRKLVNQHTAIVIEPNKHYLVEARLTGMKRKMGYESFEQIMMLLRMQHDKACVTALINSMTINETSFFRDNNVFEFLKKDVLPEIQKRKSDYEINIWCGACSSGQEPYSLMMLIKDYFPAIWSTWTLNCLATDISTDVLEQAGAGRYSQLQVNRGLPIQMLIKHFSQDGKDWLINDEFKSKISFQLLNLVKQWMLMPKMDIILLRNVLIYFDTDTKTRILQKIHQQMRSDGYLILGASETLIGLNLPFERVKLGNNHYYRPL